MPPDQDKTNSFRKTIPLGQKPAAAKDKTECFRRPEASHQRPSASKDKTGSFHKSVSSDPKPAAAKDKTDSFRRPVASKQKPTEPKDKTASLRKANPSGQKPSATDVLTCRNCRRMERHRIFRDQVRCEKRPDLTHPIVNANLLCQFFQSCTEEDVVKRESSWQGWTSNFEAFREKDDEAR